MEISLRRLRRYEYLALAGFLLAGAIGVVATQRDADSLASAAETAAEAQTEAAVLWQLAALDPRALDDSGRFAAALTNLAALQSRLETAARSSDVPEALRDLMDGQSYTLADRLADQIALGRRLVAPGPTDDVEHLLADFHHEIADSLAPRIDQAGRFFHIWANQRALHHSRAIAQIGGVVLGLAVLIALAFLPFEFRLRRNITLLEWLAARDALTGALNRGAFLARLTPLLLKAREQAGVGLIRFDLDDFRALNAKSGDEAGDSALHAVGSRLRNAVDGEALVGRLGSDSFVVALPDLAGGRTGLAAEAARLTQAVAQPLVFGDQLLRISVSAGTALAPHDSRERSELIRMSEVALRDAKRIGKDRVCAYHTGETQAQARRDAVMAALAHEDMRGLEPWLQPIVTCGQGVPVRFEVLARWHHPKLGQIAPGEFLPIAEAMGKLARVSAAVRNAAIVALAEIDLELGAQAAPLGLSVNFSLVEMLMPDVLPAMEAALRSAGIAMSRISVELTEEILSGGGDAAAQKSLQELRQRGASLYLDNFGTGFASLSNLHRFPLDALKIARPFIGGIGRSARAEAIVRGVIGLAHGLGIQAVAEGVESAAELDFVREAGCDFAQGYFIAPPMSARSAVVWLKEQRQFAQPA